MARTTTEQPSNNVRRRIHSGGGPADALLTVKEVAALDRCSEKTVRRAIEAGRLRTLRIGVDGRLIRIRKADHAAYRAGIEG